MTRDQALMVAKAALKAQVSPILRRVAIMYGDACLSVDLNPCRRTERRERRYRWVLRRALESGAT